MQMAVSPPIRQFWQPGQFFFGEERKFLWLAGFGGFAPWFALGLPLFDRLIKQVIRKFKIYAFRRFDIVG